jgi:DNA-binding IclR family transcriptional regulator
MKRSIVSKYNMSTIQRAIDVLNLFRKNDTLTFTEIQELIKFNKSTLFRVLYTLEENKYLSRDEHGRYELGITIYILGNQASQANKLKTIASPSLNRLSQQNNATVHLGTLDGMEVVIIDKYDAPNSFKTVSRAGKSVPAHCTGQGKTLLAYSPREVVEQIIGHQGMTRFTPNTITTLDGLLQEFEKIRERGFTIDDSEHEKHTRCIAVPILNKKGQIEAAISMTALIMDLPDEETIAKKAKIIQNTRDEILRNMEYI